MATNKASQVITGVARQTLCAVIPAKAGIFLALGTLILAACGGETTENVTNISQMGMDVVSSVGDLPKCTGDNEGEQAFVKGETSARICVDGKWFATASNGGEGVATEFSCATKELSDKSGLKIICNGDSIGVVLNGADGKDGVNGKDGSDGEDGVAGRDGKDGADGKGCSIASQTDSTVTVACGTGKFTMNLNGGSSVVLDTTGYEVENASISGVSQKGPFVKGTLVTAYELDGSKSLLQTGRTFSGSITQDDGRFNLSNVTLKSSYVRLSANGYYRNEVTGNNSTSPITLNAVTDLSSRNTVNVNLLTHLEYGRVSHLMGAGDGTLKIKQVKKQAEKEIFDAFYIDATGFGYSEDLDVFGKTEADAALLAISILLQGDRTESELTELLTEFSNDLSEDGKWDDAEKRAEIASWAFEKEFIGEIVDYRSYVEGWGLSTIVPDFEKYVHQFWSEEVGKCNDINEGELVEVPYRNVLAMVKCENGVWNTHALKDSRDGQDYHAIKIGDQVWMAENLNFKTDSSFCYNNEETNCANYGRLYTWAAAMDSVGTWSTNGKGCGYNNKTCSPTYPVRGVCPEGWHLPTKAEFETLFTAVGGQSTAGKVLKSKSGWNSSGNGTDTFGFSALPAGIFEKNTGELSGEGNVTYFWSSIGDVSYDAYCMSLRYGRDDAILGPTYKDNGFSVRCLKD